MFGAFGVLSAKLSALFWHCESLVHEKTDLVVSLTKNFGFLGLRHLYPKYDIGHKEFRK